MDLTYPLENHLMESRKFDSMVTPGELCDLTAKLLGHGPNTTAIAWRALRENSQVTSGGRGRSAAQCVPADAANLLIATLGKLPLMSYFKSWERYSTLKGAITHPSPGEGFAITNEFAPLLAKPRHTLKEGMTALLSAATLGSLQDFLREYLGPQESVPFESVLVGFIAPLPQAFIAIRNKSSQRGLHLFYSETSDTYDPDGIVEWPRELPREAGDLRIDMKISGRTIFALGQALGTVGGRQ
jgi:hypothetical protein